MPRPSQSAECGWEHSRGSCRSVRCCQSTIRSWNRLWPSCTRNTNHHAFTAPTSRRSKQNDFVMAEKHHTTETPDTSHIKNIDVTHEQSDVQVGGIVKFIIGLSILTIVTFVALLGLFMLFQKTATQSEQETHRSPIAMSGEERLPPEPRLQSAPGFAQNLERATPEEHVQPTPQSGFAPPKEPMWQIH